MIIKEVYEEQVALSNRWKSMYYEKKEETERLNNIIEEIKKIIKWSHEEHEFQGAIHSIEELIKKDN